MLKTFGVTSALILSILLAYFFLAPSGLDPLPWSPPQPPPLSGPYAPNDELTKAELLAQGQLIGPEDVAAGPNGWLYAGLANGDIVRVDQQQQVSTLINTEGRPLGLEFDARGRLLIADAEQGLLRLTLPNRLEVLSTRADQKPIGFADDLTIDSKGVVYFSDASQRWDIHHYRMDGLEARPHGRLLAYHPGETESRVLMDSLYFANGVALAQDESFILVNETFRYRVLRYWLKGERAGESEVFLDNLPGFPDGISTDSEGHFWIAFVSPRNPLLDRLHPYPWLKELSIKLPPFLQPKPEHYGFIARYDDQGQLLEQLQDPSGQYLYQITSVADSPQGLLLGSLTADRIGRLARDWHTK